MAIERYNPKQAEIRWQRQWDEAKIFETDNDSPDPKYYVLEMFPYPSGRIHMGHVRNYTMGDVVARYQTRQGFQRAAPDGLGRLWHAGGKRCDAEQGPSAQVDL
jgi:leucyl-tRNA synthetase